jgi:hypothetical protein
MKLDQYIAEFNKSHTTSINGIRLLVIDTEDICSIIRGYTVSVSPSGKYCNVGNGVWALCSRFDVIECLDSV